jgi:hypothetical protein
MRTPPDSGRTLPGLRERRPRIVGRLVRRRPWPPQHSEPTSPASSPSCERRFRPHTITSVSAFDLQLGFGNPPIFRRTYDRSQSSAERANRRSRSSPFHGGNCGWGSPGMRSSNAILDSRRCDAKCDRSEADGDGGRQVAVRDRERAAHDAEAAHRRSGDPSGACRDGAHRGAASSEVLRQPAARRQQAGRAISLAGRRALADVP